MNDTEGDSEDIRAATPITGPEGKGLRCGDSVVSTSGDSCLVQWAGMLPTSTLHYLSASGLRLLQ